MLMILLTLIIVMILMIMGVMMRMVMLFTLHCIGGCRQQYGQACPVDLTMPSLFTIGSDLKTLSREMEIWVSNEQFLPEETGLKLDCNCERIYDDPDENLQ